MKQLSWLYLISCVEQCLLIKYPQNYNVSVPLLLHPPLVMHFTIMVLCMYFSGEELESSTRSSLINEERKGKLWVTSHQDSSVEGLVSHKGCIFIVHSAHDRLYVYKCGSLTDSSDIPMMIYPKDMSILTDDVSTKLIIADTSNRLHWITVDDKGAKVVFSTYSMRVHYQPWSLSADNQTQQVVAVDKNKPELHVYNSQGESLTWCNIRGDLSPSSIVSTTKVYGLCDYRRNNMVLMTRNGAFMRRLQAVDQRRGMKPIYMTGGENGGIMVVDAMYNRVLLFSDAGEYICSLIGQQDDFPNIVRVCLDKVHYRLHLAFETKSPDSNSVKTIKILSIDYNELK